MDQKAYMALESEMRSVLSRCAEKFGALAEARYTKWMQDKLKKYRDEGVEILVPSGKLMDELQNASRALNAEWFARLESEAQAIQRNVLRLEK